jgi:hypothetical protein
MPNRLANGAKTCSDSVAIVSGHGRLLAANQRSVCSRDARRSSTTRRSREKASSILRTRSVCKACWPASWPWPCWASRAARWICTSLRVSVTRLA